MFVNGCHVVSDLNKDGEEGFSSVVSRSRVTGQIKDESGNFVDVVEKVSRGPFFSLEKAIRYAHSWSDIDNPPEIVSPTVVPPSPVEPEPEQTPEPTPAE